MKFCGTHWTKLQAVIEDRGLKPFCAKDARTAALQLAKDVQRRASGKDTFDPLQRAHWAIVGNSIAALERAGDKFVSWRLLTSDRCPLCELNEAHERTCTDPLCCLDKKTGYDWMIDRAVEDEVQTARSYGLIP